MNLPGGPGVRMDSGLFRGLEITPHYDSMLAKLIVHGEDRDHAIARAQRALGETRIVGVSTSVPVGLRVFESEEFRSGDYDTGILTRIPSTLGESSAKIASLAAAAAEYLGTERLDDRGGSPNGEAPSPWTLLERVDLLGWRRGR